MKYLFYRLIIFLDTANENDTNYNIAWFMIDTILIENISTLIYTNIINTNISSGIEMFDLIEILFVFSMSYIFKYGHQLQVDSNAIMYGDEKE